jgi:hypothetical protein
MTYGSVSWTPGKLKLDAGLTAVDYYQTRGSFHKVQSRRGAPAILACRLELDGPPELAAGEPTWTRPRN